MAVGMMGMSSPGSTDTDRVLNWLDLLADPARSKTKLEAFTQREAAAKSAEAVSRQAKAEADRTIAEAVQVRRDLDQRSEGLEKRAAELASRESAIHQREERLAAGERELRAEGQRLATMWKQRNSDLAKQLGGWGVTLTRLATDPAAAV
jgi:chromosome segregation ATPase